MPALSETIARLKTQRLGPNSSGTSARLQPFGDFGGNPGNLRGFAYVPEGLGKAAPLVVALHGCTQTAAGYDLGTGWSQLADRHGFALLMPEQQRQNNANACFNWFVPDDISRASGEALSIAEITSAAVGRFALDPDRVYITGLSAGGAMTMVMLATYPEMFAGGGVIAGLPYGEARTMNQALDRMRGGTTSPADAMAAHVRRASAHKGPWPTLSVWHGSADHVVAPSNGSAIVEQWLAIQDGKLTHRNEAIGRHQHECWLDPAGRIVIERYTIQGMGHGVPLDLSASPATGAAGPHMFDVGLSSSERLAASWGLCDQLAAAPPADRPRPSPPPPSDESQRAVRRPAVVGMDIGKVISDALRAAGLTH